MFVASMKNWLVFKGDESESLDLERNQHDHLWTRPFLPETYSAVLVDAETGAVYTQFFIGDVRSKVALPIVPTGEIGHHRSVVGMPNKTVHIAVTPLVAAIGSIREQPFYQ